LNLRALCCSCSDTAPALVALGAHIKIAGPSGEKMIPLEKFFILPSVDYKRENILTGGEIVTEIIVPAPKPVARVSTTKYGSGSPGDHAIVAVATIVESSGGAVRDARVVMGGVAPIRWRAGKAEEFLRNKAVKLPWKVPSRSRTIATRSE
jgi:xanthine dehydrogenase YagS FAD-binding subunit